MTKVDVCLGDVVELRSGFKCIVTIASKYVVLFDPKTQTVIEEMANYNDDLTFKFRPNLDIMKVYKPARFFDLDKIFKDEVEPNWEMGK